MDTLELIKLAKDGDISARNRVIEDNLGLVWSVIRRFTNRGHELDDLYQIGCIGLLKAVDKFDLTFDVKFSTYAVPMITGEVKRFLRDDGMVKVSRSLKETAYKVRQTREAYIQSNNKEPTIDEIAFEMHMDAEEIVAALDATREVESIYKTIYESDGNGIYLMDKLTNEREECQEIVDVLAVTGVVEELDELEQKLIKLRYYEEKTQTQIADILGISQVQVSRMEKRILKHLRKQLDE